MISRIINQFKSLKRRKPLTQRGQVVMESAKEPVSIFPYLIYYKPGLIQYFLISSASTYLFFGLYKTKFELDDQLGLFLYAISVAIVFLMLIWANNRGFFKQKDNLAQTLHERPTLYLIIAKKFIDDIQATSNEFGQLEKSKVRAIMDEIFPEAIAIARTDSAMQFTGFELLVLMPSTEYDRLCQFYIKKYNL
jgi:hypothetical protein